MTERDISGAKIILHCDGALITYLRDDKASIPFPAMWDLPGGGMEGNESPKDCALRETYEEFGIVIAPERITWGKRYTSPLHSNKFNWFYAAPVTPDEISQIHFGEEGQFWQMMAINAFITHNQAVPHLKSQVRDYLAEKI